MESKYITAADYNKFTKDIVDNSINCNNSVDKAAIVGFINNTDLDTKVATLATKAELKAEQDKMINYKNLIQVVLEVIVILKKMVLKII